MSKWMCGTLFGPRWFQRYHHRPFTKTAFIFVSVFYLTNTHTKPPHNIIMPSPLRQVAWECGDCTTTNQGRELLPCLYCCAENPRRYEILSGSAPAATARTTYVMHTEQHDIVRAASKASVAVILCPIVDRTLLAEHLMGTKVNVIRTEMDENGRTCHVSGSQLVPGSKVRSRKETVISPTMCSEEDCLIVYIVGDGVMT